MKVIKNSEYYKQFNDILKHDLREIDYHTRQAVHYKKIYEMTKSRHGFYSLLNKFAYRRNQYHHGKALQLGLKDFCWCFEEITDLNKFLSEQGEP